jgi:predicted nucleic acid-binding protein
MKDKPRLFLDTSALFTGIWSTQGGARMLLRLGEAEAVRLLVSSQVLGEIEDVIHRKAVEFLPTLAVLLDRSRLSVVPAASQEMLERCQALVHHAGDARILADAWHNQVDYLVTLDRAHFLDAPGLGEVPFPIGTPGDCLNWYREKLKENRNPVPGPFTPC